MEGINIMATIRNRLGKIHMFTRGRDFGVPEYLAEKGLDVNVEYVRNGMNDEMLAIEVFETQEIAREKDDDKTKALTLIELVDSCEKSCRIQ